MKRLLAACLTVGLAVPIGIGVTVIGAATDTQCWDEYNLAGSRFYGTLTSKGRPIEDCTPADRCFTGYNRAGTQNRVFVPRGADPRSACTAQTTTTSSTTTSAPTTTAPTPSTDRFVTLAPGSELPSDFECASRVRPMTENRPGNATANTTPGTDPHDEMPRVTGNFTGTTDEIIQWTACKWGIDEDLVRAQIVVESFWNHSTLGDFTTVPNACAPGFPIGNYPSHDGECPESVGLGQVRWLYHQAAFEENNAVKSSAYNLDYTYAVWRECFEGDDGWLNTVEGRGDYSGGDAIGCQGVWFSGRWYTDAATDYIARVQDHLTQRTWEQGSFGPAYPTPVITTGTRIDSVSTTTVATSSSTSTTAPSPPTTAASTSTTTITTTAPSTTTTAVVSTATTPAASDGFVETFDANTGLDRFDVGVFNREGSTSGTVQGDHDLACGGPDTHRTVRGANPAESFYMCKDHLMTAIGDWSGYSVGWFSPARTFTTERRVTWDVNVTDLGGRQWWEVMVVPASFNSGFASCPQCAVQPWLSPDPAHLPAYPKGAIVVGNGAGGKDVNIHHNGGRYTGWQHTCGQAWDWFSDECTSKAIRVPFAITDNGNGTITVDYGGKFTETFAGSFPAEYRVIFKDHNYTPDKEGIPVGHTWHWDNIIVQ